MAEATNRSELFLLWIGRVPQRFYACEVKNADQKCPDFSPDGSRRRACTTCAYNQMPCGRLYQTLIQVLSERREGQRIRSDVDMTLQSQAAGEYKQCVDSAGFMNTRPGLLPICEKYSSEAGYVIGPIVNAGNSCPHWSAGTSAVSQSVLARLDLILERAKRIWALPPPPSPRGFNFNPTSYSDSIQKQQELKGNAKADIVEYCLTELGVNPSYAEFAATTFIADVYFGSRTPGGVQAALTEIESGKTQPEAASTEADLQTPSASPGTFGTNIAANLPLDAYRPFEAQLNTYYFHPTIAGLRLYVTALPGNGFASVVLPNGQTLPFDLGAFQPRAWTPLLAPFGELPLILAVEPPHKVQAWWKIPPQ